MPAWGCDPEEGVAAMAENGTIATLMPTVPLTLMKPQWAPAQRLKDAFVPIALASDHNPNNPVTDMGLVAQMGCYEMGLTPAQALTAVTWNAAHALGVSIPERVSIVGFACVVINYTVVNLLMTGLHSYSGVAS